MRAFEVQFRQEILMQAEYYGLPLQAACVAFQWGNDKLVVSIASRDTLTWKSMPADDEHFHMPYRAEFQRDLILDLLACLDGVRAEPLSKQDIMYRRIEGASINEYQTKGTHKIYVKHLNTPLHAPPRSLLNSCCL